MNMEDSKAIQGALYGRLRGDMAISDGAFRLWHVLNGMAGQKGYCWPGRRGLAIQYRWSIHSLKPWIQQLIDGGYLRVEKFDRARHPGIDPRHNGLVYFPANAVAGSGHSPVGETGHSPVVYSGQRAVSSMSNQIKQRESSKGMKGKAPPSPERWKIDKDRVRINQRMDEIRKGAGMFKDETGWHGKDKLTAEDRDKLAKHRASIKQLNADFDRATA